MEQMIGKQSVQFERAVHILSAASIVGKKEGDGPLGKCFDRIGEAFSHCPGDITGRLQQQC